MTNNPGSQNGGVVRSASAGDDLKRAKNISGIDDCNHSRGSNDEDDEERRLDAVWAKAGKDFKARWTPPLRTLSKEISGGASGPETINGTGREKPSSERAKCDISPLMKAHLPNTMLRTSNRTSLMSNGGAYDDERIFSIINRHICQEEKPETSSLKQSLVQKYALFLRRHLSSLDLVEHAMEKFVFYGYLFKHDYCRIRAEMYYATWHLVRWINDVVLVGLGEGMGTTVGRRDEWLIPFGKASSESMLLRMNSFVSILRVTLTVTTCVYPAMEAWSRRCLYFQPSYGTSLMPYDDAAAQPQNQQEKYQAVFATTCELSPQRLRREWATQQSRAAQASYRLERVRFFLRVALLSISWWAQHRRGCSHGEEDGATQDLVRENANERERMLVPSLLRRGGELDPHEQLVLLENAEEEAKVVQYVGRRTGRRSIARFSASTSSLPSSRSHYGSQKCSAFLKLLSRLASSRKRIFYKYSVGELLHILRPLYWSHAENREWRRRSSFSKISHSQYSFAIWKAWWVSLLMDLISDKLLRVTQDGDSTAAINTQLRWQDLFLIRGGNRHTLQQLPLCASPSAEQAKLEELDWRRSRLGLYLLRSPMYNFVTRPLATLMGRLASMIPSFGFGRWVSGYVLDMMNYWNDNHFMLES